jgi:hypothetical protein
LGIMAGAIRLRQVGNLGAATWRRFLKGEG